MKIFKIVLLCIITFLTRAEAQEFTFKLLTGEPLQELKFYMIAQRITEFKEYPYLYEANHTEEHEHAEWFLNLPDTAAAVVYFENMPVGYISGTSLVDFDANFKGSIHQFKAAGLNPYEYFYISEAIIEKRYRNNKLLRPMHELLEKYAQERGYTSICFVTEEHKFHPLKPTDYKPLDDVYKKAGYTKTDVTIQFSYMTIQPNGVIAHQAHLFTYWIKDITQSV